MENAVKSNYFPHLGISFCFDATQMANSKCTETRSRRNSGKIHSILPISLVYHFLIIKIKHGHYRYCEQSKTKTKKKTVTEKPPMWVIRVGILFPSFY